MLSKSCSHFTFIIVQYCFHERYLTTQSHLGSSKVLYYSQKKEKNKFIITQSCYIPHKFTINMFDIDLSSGQVLEYRNLLALLKSTSLLPRVSFGDSPGRVMYNSQYFHSYHLWAEDLP